MNETDNKQLDLSVVQHHLNKGNTGFRLKKQPHFKDKKQECCEICGIGFDRQIQQPEIGMMIITCYGCLSTCHYYCYGLSTEVEILSNANNQGYFQCDKCKTNKHQDYPCVICNAKQGLKKKLYNSNEFVHPLCAQFSKQIEIMSFIEMKFCKLNQLDKPNTEKSKQNSQACVYCKGSIGTIKCNKCNASAHVYCIILKITDIGGFKLDYSETSKENQWQFSFNYKQLLTIDNIIQSKKEKLLLKNYVQNIFDSFMKIQGVKKQINLDLILQSYFKNDKIEEEKESILSWTCFKHKSSKIYCYCKQEVDSDDMVQCEICSEWFHDQCVKKYQKDFDEQKSKPIYSCPFCIKWSKNKLNHILRFNPVSNLNKLFPPIFKLNFISLILIGIYCERTLDKLILKYNETEYQIVQSILSNLPFPNSLLQQSNQIEQKSKQTEFMNFIFAQKIPYREESQWLIRSQLDEHNNTIPENIQHNKALQNKLLQVINLFKDFDECKFYQEQLHKLNHLQKAFEIIIMNQKITKNTILMEYQSNQFQEFIYLQQQIPTYKKIKKEFVSKLQVSHNKFKDFQSKFNRIIDSSEEEEEDEDDDLEDYEKLQKYFELDVFPIQTYQEFFDLISQSRMKLNSIKVNVDFVNKIIKQIQNLSIKVSWIQYIEQDLNQGQQIIEQLEDQKLNNQNNSIKLLLNEMELSYFYYKDFPKHYAFLSKIKLYELYIQDLDYQQDIEDDDDDDSEVQQVNKEIQIKISIPHLQMLKDLQKETNASQQEIQLLNRVELQMNEYRQKLRNIIQLKGLNEQLRKKYQAELQMNKFYDVPEIKELQQKLEVFQEIEKIRISKIQTLQQLEMCLEKSKQYNFDDKIINQFENEINKHLQKKKEIQKLLENQTFENEQLDQAKQFLQEIAQSKIIFEEKQQLQSLNKACQFIQQLYEFYQKYKSPEQEMEIEDDKNPDLQFKINQIQNPFSIIFKNDQEQMIIDLEIILSKQQTILDKRIYSVFNQYSNFLWQKQAKTLLFLQEQKQEITLQLVESVIYKQFKLENNEQIKLDCFIELFTQQFTILNQIIAPLQEYLNKQPKEISLKDWFEGYNQINLNIKGGIWDQVKIYNVWVTIITKFQEIENSSLHTYESLKLLQEIIQMSHMPKYSAIIQIINSRVNNFNNLVDKFREYGQRKLVFLEKKKSKQDLQSKQKSNFTIQDAAELEQRLKKINNMVHDFFSKEFCQDLENIKQIQDDFNNCQIDDIQMYTQTYQRLTQSFIQDEYLLDRIKLKIYQSKIKDIIKGRKTVELYKAKKQYTSLLNLMEQSNDGEFEEYIQQFNKQLTIAENVQSLANKVKNEQDYTFEELELCVFDMEKISNILIENKEDILMKYQECQQVKKEIYDIQNSTIKIKEIIIQNLLQKLEDLPFQDDIQLVQNWLNQYQQLKENYIALRQLLQKEKTYHNGKQLTDLIKKLQKLNEESVIIHVDVDHLLRDYSEFNKKLEQIEKDIQSDQTIKDFQDLQNNLRWGEQYERVRMAIWIKQINQFKDGKHSKQGFSSFQNLLKQGYEILDSALLNNQKIYIEKLKGPIIYLELLMNKIIDSISNGIGTHSLIEGKIDISQLQLELQHTSTYQKQEQLKVLQPKKPYDNINQYLDKIKNKQKKKIVPPSDKDKTENNYEEKKFKKVKKSSYDNDYEKLRIGKRNELLNAMKQIQILKDRKDLNEKVKEIENQQFGEYVGNKQKYEENMQIIIATYKELQKCPNYSKQLFSATINLETTAKVVQKYQDHKLQKCEDKYNKQFKQQEQNTLNKGNLNLQTQKIKLKSQSQSTQLRQQPQTQSNIQLDQLNQSFNESYQLIQKLQEQQKQQQQQEQQQQQQSQQQSSSKFQNNTQLLQSSRIKIKQKQQQDQMLPNRSSSQDSLSQEFSEYKLVSNSKVTQADYEEKDLKAYLMKKEVIPYIYGDKLTKIGQNGTKLILPDGSIYLIDYFSHQTELRQNKFPKIIQDLKFGNYQDQEYILKEIEIIIKQYRQQVLSGQIIPERLQDLEALNRISEELLKDHKILEYKLVDTIVCLMHHEQILKSDYFINFRLEEIILKQHLIKQDEIQKQLENYTSNLCFVITLKQQQQGILVSNFSGISIEIIKNLSQSQEFRKWKESRKNKDKMQIKQMLEKQKPQSEPVTSEDGFNENNNQGCIRNLQYQKNQKGCLLKK